MNKEVRKLVQQLTPIEGIEAVINGQHVKVYRDGQLITTLPKTPSDHRWKANAVAELRRQGITPGAKLDRTLRYREESFDRDALRERLSGMVGKRGAPGPFNPFVRFMLADVAPHMTSVASWGTVNSAETALRMFIRDGKNVSDDKLSLVSEALRMWEAKEGGKRRAAAATKPMPAPVIEPLPPEPVAAVEVAESAEPTGQPSIRVTIEVSGEQLAEVAGLIVALAARFTR